MVAKIRVRWPDGAICGPCFTLGVRTRGACSNCGEDRLLPGRDPDGHPLCRDCAGISTNMTCKECGAEAERYGAGNCIRCVLRHDLTVLLKPNDPPDLRLRRLIEILATSARPESIHTWMRGNAANQILTMLGSRELTLEHASFDALPHSAAVEHLRDILTHHHMLPLQPDKSLANFERWLGERLTQLADRPTVQQPIEQFARWHHLKRLRSPKPGRNMITACLTARQEITEAGKFLTWLNDTHNITADQLRQQHVDEYLADGPSTKKHIRNFLHWLSRSQSRRRRVTTSYRKAITTPLITQDQRVELVANCLTFQQVALSTRVAALIFLLWAQPLNKISQLTSAAINTRPDGMRVTLGETESDVPTLIAGSIWNHISARGNQQTTNTGTNLLFPGYRAGQPIHPVTLAQRFHTLGIDTQRVRNTTLRDLTHQLDPRSLADLLGYSPRIIALHAARAATPMSDYITLKRENQRNLD
ncbi:hypothetical protein GCM10009563_12470 [Subtercola frigoramans]